MKSTSMTRACAWLAGGLAALTSMAAPAQDATSAADKTATTTVLTASSNPVIAGTTVGFSAVVANSGTGTAAPTGTVKFFDDGVEIGRAKLHHGTAKLDATLTTLGKHRIRATYIGDPGHVWSSASKLGVGDVVLLMHMDGAPTDSSSYAHIPSASDSPSFSTTIKRVGKASAHYEKNSNCSGLSPGCDGGNYTEFAAAAEWSFGSADFTAESWVRFDANLTGFHQHLFSQAGPVGENGTFTVFMDANLYLSAVAHLVDGQGADSYVDLKDQVTLPLDTWTHVALVRQGDTFTLYKNGVAVASQIAGGPLYENDVDPFAVGADGAYIGTTGGDEMTHTNGYIDDLRITRGAALYTTTFTPPTSLPDPVLTVIAP